MWEIPHKNNLTDERKQQEQVFTLTTDVQVHKESECSRGKTHAHTLDGTTGTSRLSFSRMHEQLV